MTPDRRGELEEQRDVLLDSLRDLERERAAGDLGTEDYAALRDDYTVRAAAVLRALEAAQPPAASRRARGPAAHRRSVGVTVAVALGLAALAGGTVVLFSTDRQPGQPLSGSLPATSVDRLSRAVELDRQGRAVDALKLYDEVLREDPSNVAALAYRGWLLKRAGLVDAALASLDRAVAVDPRFPDAHFFRGMVLYQDRHDPSAAVAEFRAFLANDPPADMVAAVEEVLARALRDAGISPPAASGGG